MPTEPEDEEVPLSSAEKLLSRLQDDLERIKVTQGFQRNSEAFGFWAIQQISPSLSERDTRYALEIGGPGDHGINAIWWDKDHRENGEQRGALHLARVMCPDFLVSDSRFGPEAAQELHRGLTWLAQANEEKLRPEFRRAKEDFENRLHGGQRIILSVVVAGAASRGLKEELGTISIELASEFLAGDVTIELFDLHRLDCLYIDRLELGDVRPPPIVNLRVRSRYLIRDYGSHRALVWCTSQT